MKLTTSQISLHDCGCHRGRWLVVIARPGTENWYRDGNSKHEDFCREKLQIFGSTTRMTNPSKASAPNPEQNNYQINKTLLGIEDNDILGLSSIYIYILIFGVFISIARSINYQKLNRVYIFFYF